MFCTEAATWPEPPAQVPASNHLFPYSYSIEPAAPVRLDDGGFEALMESLVQRDDTRTMFRSKGPRP
jgi:hypothetical protein